jgi:CheY-like chemotaxis protein
VVDDNATNRRILVEMLTHWGMRPIAVEGAASALTALRAAHAAGRSFGLMLTDAHMPDTDGFTLAAEVRATPELRGVTMLMLSSAGRPGDAARCREVGIAAYLTKPVTQSELLDAIQTARAPEAAPAALVTRHVLRERRQRLHVLLAEDNQVNQTLATRLLERQGHRVAVVGNGHEALAALERGTFDLVLMDVQMPELDGLEATAAIREREARVAAGTWTPPVGSSFATRRRMPVIALTAHAMESDETKCRAAGMDGFVSKPVKPAELAAAVQAFGPREDDGGGPDLSAPLAACVDPAAALRTAGGDRALLAELAAAFVADCPRRVAELRAALGAQEATRLERAAHALKGAVATFGAARARELADALETRGRERRLTDAPALAVELERELAEVTSALADPGWPGGDGAGLDGPER